ncbi:MAG: efflux RND transporter permease subunit [Phycisphaeraceae bacterium]|nr:efflux RND transporter permease subunit [Phycisphaeraceae bacterium]MBX3405208.1 efflux RND transporter permease subunit [Phycisphaeraceae bacterium]
MQRLAEVCIQRPVFAAMLILAMVVVGATAYTRLGVDRLPSVDLPTVSVRTSLPGASPEEVETEVSQIIEEAVNTVEGIEELRSISGQGNSIVLVTFRLERDIEAAAQDVRDRVATAVRRLPADAEAPIVSKFDNDSSPVLTIALSGELSLRELTEIADKTAKPQLERSVGVGEVSIVGGLERSINVWVDADRLAAFGIPITAVREAIARQNADVPGGNLTGQSNEQVLRTLGRIDDPEAFNDIIIAMVNSAPVRVRDIGRAEDGTKEQRSASRLDGRAAVTLQVRRQSGANTVQVIEGVKGQLETVRAQMPPGVKMEVIRDQSRYIYAALHEINVHLLLGSTLACLVVLAFMRSWRSTLIAGVAIPASVVSTFAVMWVLDFTLNSVTMLALVLMVGIVIDDAIVVLENIFRMVEEKGLPPLEAAKRGTAEIGLAVLATTLSLVVIFVPVSFMSSISGRFLYQFGITAAVAVMVSLLVSFTLTPMLSARALRGMAQHAHGATSRRGFYRYIDGAYTAMLRIVMRFRFVAAVAGVLVMLSAVPLYGLLRQDYLPSDIDEAEFEINIIGPEGVSFAGMDDAMRAVEERVRAHPAVRTTLTSVGGSFLGQVNRGDIYVRIAPHRERVLGFSRLWDQTRKGDPLGAWRGNYTQREVMQDLRRSLRGLPDLRASVRNFPSFNVGGGNFDIDLAIRGPDLERLAEYTEELRRRGLELGGMPDLDTTLKLTTPELRVHIDRDRAADLGVTPRDIGTALRILVGGDDEVTRFRDPATSEDYDVQLRLLEKDRSDEATLPRLLVPASGRPGQVVELRSIASLAPATTAARIDRLDRQRAANVRGTVGPGYALSDRLEAMRAEIEAMDIPPAYTVRTLGRGRELERTFVEFLFAFMLSIVFMYMILASNYESLIHPVTILLSLPLAIPFAFLSLYLAGQSINLYTALGILVLFGVVKKNAILQIDHMNQLRAAGMPRAEAIIQGNRDRLRPILMTTLALVGGMTPLALGTGPGSEERRAVAVVVIGGQSLSLLLTLLFTPVAYSIFDDAGVAMRRMMRPRGSAALAPAAAHVRD